MTRNNFISLSMYALHLVARVTLYCASMMRAEHYRTILRDWGIYRAKCVKKNKANKPETDKT